MNSQIVKVQDRKAPYETPAVTVHGTFESLTRHDTDGARFDMSFNAGDPIPPAFAS
jgi:hypothetical protein